MMLMLIITFNYGCNEELVFSTTEKKEPVIESFEPVTGSYNDEITIKGDYLGDVSAIYFGDSLATIKYRVSSNELVAKLTKGCVSGNITVKNNVGSITSVDEFTVNYPVPTITEFEDKQVLPNSSMKIEGTNMDVVYDVYFGSSKANIIESNEDFIIVEVPFFEEEEEPANVSLSYNGGTLNQVQSSGQITLFRIFPEFNVIPDQGVTNTNIVFEGTNLTLIDEMWFDDQLASFSVNETGDELVVNLTEEQFAVTATGVTVNATYFGGTQVVALHEDFTVVVPTVEYYSNITLKPRGAEGEYFLDFNTGLVYDACADWTTVLQPNISLVAYASKSGYIQFRQAGNAGSVIKNYKCDGVNLPSENCVKVSKMGVLDPTNAEHQVYIDAVKNKTLNDIDSDVVSGFGASSSDLKIYTTGTGNEDAFGAGDVIVFKQTWNDETKYGFIEVLEAVADIPENIGQASGDGSYFKFNYYFQK